MSLQPYLTRTALLLALSTLVAAAGCQKQSESEQKEDPTAKVKQVTVEVTGMT